MRLTKILPSIAGLMLGAMMGIGRVGLRTGGLVTVDWGVTAQICGLLCGAVAALWLVIRFDKRRRDNFKW